MKPTRVIWVVLLMAAALAGWLCIPSQQPTPLRSVAMTWDSPPTFLLGSTHAGQTNGTITGILSDPQFRVVIHALEERGGADRLNPPKVTTRPERSINRISLDETSLTFVVTNR